MQNSKIIIGLACDSGLNNSIDKGQFLIYPDNKELDNELTIYLSKIEGILNKIFKDKNFESDGIKVVQNYINKYQSKQLEIKEKTKDIKNIKNSLNDNGFNISLLSGYNVIFLDYFYNTIKNFEQEKETHQQNGKVIMFKIVNVKDAKNQYDNLLKLIEDYNSFEEYRDLRYRASSLSGNNIYITIDFNHY